MYIDLFKALENDFNLKLVDLNTDEIGIITSHLNNNEKASVINFINAFKQELDLKINVYLFENDLIIKHY